MFDCQIQPILTYGSEIWGLMVDQECIERIHLSALKRFMGVSPKASRHLIYGETGRYPLYVNTYTRCVKFWLRLVCMEEHRYPKKAYNMLLSLQNQNYVTWACRVRNVLFKYGFGTVWEAQGVGNIKLFLLEFKQRLTDAFRQDWHAALEAHDFFQVYSSFNQTVSIKSYLFQVRNINLRKCLARFRIGMSSLKHSYLQYRPQPSNSDSCPFCCDELENEVHFLFVCPKYSELREELIPAKYYRHPSLFKFSLIIANENYNVIWNTSMFIHRALSLRR